MVTIIGENDWSAVIFFVICLCVILIVSWILLRIFQAVGAMVIYYWRGGLSKFDIKLRCILDGDAGHGMEYVSTILEKEGSQRVEGPEGLEYVLETSPVMVKHHRRVHKHNRIPYMTSIVAEVKMRFGTPQKTLSNEKAVHRYASELMRKHGLRPTHARQMLPLVVAASFIPDKWEVKASQLSSCDLARERLEVAPPQPTN